MDISLKGGFPDLVDISLAEGIPVDISLKLGGGGGGGGGGAEDDSWFGGHLFRRQSSWFGGNFFRGEGLPIWWTLEGGIYDLVDFS